MRCSRCHRLTRPAWIPAFAGMTCLKGRRASAPAERLSAGGAPQRSTLSASGFTTFDAVPLTKLTTLSNAALKYIS